MDIASSFSAVFLLSLENKHLELGLARDRSFLQR